LFYYASDIAFGPSGGTEPSEETEKKLKERLHELITDALVTASQAKFDVFNALSLMDNWSFLSDLKVILSL
jgi:glycylpeptide N-tetradecanoyltransferase